VPRKCSTFCKYCPPIIAYHHLLAIPLALGEDSKYLEKLDVVPRVPIDQDTILGRAHQILDLQNRNSSGGLDWQSYLQHHRDDISSVDHQRCALSSVSASLKPAGTQLRASTRLRLSKGQLVTTMAQTKKCMDREVSPL